MVGMASTPDDRNVAGRVRPYHGHADGSEHAHPGGGEPHWHEPAIPGRAHPMTADAPLTADELAAIRRRITDLGLTLTSRGWEWDVSGPELEAEDISTTQYHAVRAEAYADLTITAPTGAVALRLERARAGLVNGALVSFLVDAPDLVPRLLAEVDRLTKWGNDQDDRWLTLLIDLLERLGYHDEEEADGPGDIEAAVVALVADHELMRSENSGSLLDERL